MNEKFIILFVINLCITILVLLYMLNKKDKQFNNLYENVGKQLGIKENVSKPIISRDYELTCYKCKFKNRFRVTKEGHSISFSTKEIK